MLYMYNQETQLVCSGYSLCIHYAPPIGPNDMYKCPGNGVRVGQKRLVCPFGSPNMPLVLLSSEFCKSYFVRVGVFKQYPVNFYQSMLFSCEILDLRTC